MIVYVDMDGVLCDFEGAHDRDLKRNPGVKYPQSQYGFYQNLAPLRVLSQINYLAPKNPRCNSAYAARA